MAGAAGLALGAVPLLDRAAAAADPDVGRFVTSLFTARAAAASTGESWRISAFYDPANQALLGFERERARYLYSGVGTLWDGTILQFLSRISIELVEPSASGAVVRLNEVLDFDWVPNRHIPSLGEMKLAAQYPEKFRPIAPRGAMGRNPQQFRDPHELVLERGLSGWRAVRHEHDEFFLHGRSPDLQPGGWAAIWYGKPRAGRASAVNQISSKGPGLARPLTQQYGYTPSSAVGYALTYWSNYNTNYCDFNCSGSGGDCTNFTSQCFRQGGQIDESPWNTYNGGCGNCNPPYSRPQAGTDTWANVDLNFNFFNGHSRCTFQSDVYQLGNGDFVDYDTGSGYFSGHKTLITDRWNVEGPKVTCHTPNSLNVPWNTFGAIGHRYGFMWLTYYAPPF